MTRLKRTLGLAECIFFGVGSILGAGIYTLIGKVAGLSGNLIWLSFLLATGCALCSAFSYAELSAALPKAGGEYNYTKAAFGKKAGSFIGVLISFNGMMSAATVSVGFAGYLSTLTGIGILPAALGIIVLIFLINSWGIRQSSLVNIIFTIIEAGGLLLIIYAAFSSIGSVDYLEPPPGGFNDILGAGALAFFAFMGFEEIVKLAEESKNPEKTIPRALFITSIIVVVIYLAVAICSVSMIPYEELGKSKSPLADIAGQAYGKTGIILISIIALFATSNTILSNMLSSSRVLYNISRENRFLAFFAYLSPKRKTPLTALLFTLVVTGSFALIGKIETIARIATVFIFITFIVVNLSVIVLRIKQKQMRRPYRIPLNIKNIPVISVFGVLLTLLLLVYNIISLLQGETVGE